MSPHTRTHRRGSSTRTARPILPVLRLRRFTKQPTQKANIQAIASQVGTATSIKRLSLEAQFEFLCGSTVEGSKMLYAILKPVGQTITIPIMVEFPLKCLCRAEGQEFDIQVLRRGDKLTVEHRPGIGKCLVFATITPPPLDRKSFVPPANPGWKPSYPSRKIAVVEPVSQS